MGSCHSKLLPGPKGLKGAMESTQSSQSTVVGDAHHDNKKQPGGSHKTTEPVYPLAFGKDVLKEFSLDPDYHNLNHCRFDHPVFYQRLD